MHHDFILHMNSYRTKRSHARSRINRIFLRVVFLERKLGVSFFSSLFRWGRTSPVERDFEWQSQRNNHFKNGFSLCRRLFTSLKIYLVRRSPVLFLAFHYWSGIILFSSDLFFLLSSDLRSGILLFLFWLFSVFIFTENIFKNPTKHIFITIFCFQWKWKHKTVTPNTPLVFNHSQNMLNCRWKLKRKKRLNDLFCLLSYFFLWVWSFIFLKI